jgi:hypothetical protein
MIIQATHATIKHAAAIAATMMIFMLISLELTQGQDFNWKLIK